MQFHQKLGGKVQVCGNDAEKATVFLAKTAQKMHSKIQKSQVSKVLLEIQPVAFAVSAIRVAETIIFEMYVTVGVVNILSFGSFVESSNYYFHLNWL
jgi:hypothetical protein